MEHPPKPRLTLRVGIVGHRPEKLGPATGRIEEQLKKVFAAIERAAKALLRANKDCYAQDPHAIRLVSGFAEGADRMAVGACPSDWEVEAILPFPKDAYIATFSRHGGETEDSFAKVLKEADVVTELSPPDRPDTHHGHADQEARHREQGYAEAGGYFLRQIDLLVAVWDGLPPKIGGTGAIARHAFEGGIPVVWIITQNEDLPPRLIKAFDKHGSATAPEIDATEGPIEEVLGPILAGPSQAAQDSRTPPMTALQDFYQEDWRERCYSFGYDLLKRCANLQRPRFRIGFASIEARSGEWDDFMNDAPHADNLTHRIREILLPRFIWADSLAVHFSHNYRSAYVLAYGLSAVAVLLALLGQFTSTVDGKLPYVVGELFVIGAIIGTVLYGRHRRWHERWLDYRTLAESLRHGRFLSFISEFGHVQEEAAKESPWMLWYLRATMREVGLPAALIDRNYQWRMLNTTLKHEIDEQYEYHDGNSKSAHKIDHLLHLLGVSCFVITLIVLLLFLVGYGVEYSMRGPAASAAETHEPFLSFLKSATFLLSAGLPALGAALAGIRVHGDFEGSKERSIKMMETLGAFRRTCGELMDRENNLDLTANMLLNAARVMSEDVSAWQELYGRKRLTLPA